MVVKYQHHLFQHLCILKIHKCHFQNRLRHFDYIELFNNCGFTLLKEDLFYNEKNIPTELENLYCGKDLSWKATHAHIVMQKP